MDLLKEPPSLDLNDRSWVIHTRTEERPPARLAGNAKIEHSMIADGCVIENGACIENSVLGPGVRLAAGAIVRQSILLTDTIVESGAVLDRAILDKRVRVGAQARLGLPDGDLVMAGKNSLIPAGTVVEPGAVIGSDVVESDYASLQVSSKQTIQKTRRIPHEL
jgi:glucose-1-phosphate adenylyltransferase